MAAVLTVSREQVLATGVKHIYGTLAMDSSYPTGGETLDLSDYFSNDLLFVEISGPREGYILEHDGGTISAGKIMARYYDYDAAADGAAIEVAATTDLSAITDAMFFAVGD